jgi:hypothetical protein
MMYADLAVNLGYVLSPAVTAISISLCEPNLPSSHVSFHPDPFMYLMKKNSNKNVIKKVCQVC